jgi:hypothetical protein
MNFVDLSGGIGINCVLMDFYLCHMWFDGVGMNRLAICHIHQEIAKSCKLVLRKQGLDSSGIAFVHESRVFPEFGYEEAALKPRLGEVDYAVIRIRHSSENQGMPPI